MRTRSALTDGSESTANIDLGCSGGDVMKRWLTDRMDTVMDTAKYWYVKGERFEEEALLVIAAIFTIIYGLNILTPMPDWLHLVLGIIMGMLWAILIIDYIMSAVVSVKSRKWFISSVPDLLSAVFPILRFLKLLHFLVVFRLLKRTSMIAFRSRLQHGQSSQERHDRRTAKHIDHQTGAGSTCRQDQHVR
jgi:uncharacterized protein (DUF983 family)